MMPGTQGASANEPTYRHAIGAASYKTAIQSTIAVIGRRATLFRNLVVAVVVMGTASLMWALVTRSFAGAIGLVFLVPACGCFFYADARLLTGWRSEILDAWSTRSLHLAAFREAVRANPVVPKATLEAMLSTLPTPESVTAEHHVLVPTRKVLAAQTRSEYRTRSTVLLLDVVVSTVAATTIVAAVWSGRWKVLACLFVVGLRPVAGCWARHRQRIALREELAEARRQPDFDEAEYAALRARLATGTRSPRPNR
jgi:hypothetical protein